MLAEISPISPAEYLDIERKAERKSEYHDGRIIARESANENHCLLQISLIATLYPQLRRRGWWGFTSDMRVKIPASRSYVYPDLTIVCGEPQFEDDTSDTLLNPTAIIEILSPSTALHDRTDKFARYRRIPTLREYLLVAQDAPRSSTSYASRTASGTGRSPSSWPTRSTSPRSAARSRSPTSTPA